MKKILMIAACSGIVAFSIAGCGNKQANDQQAPSADIDTVAEKVERATLTVVPGGVSICPDASPVEPEVTWQRIDPAVKGTRLTVSGPDGSDEKLFAIGGFGGSAKAGDWVVPGVTFHLYDADTGAALAAYTMTEVPCSQ